MKKMILAILSLGVAVLLTASLVPRELAFQEKGISAVLDDFHEAASEADYERYFSHFATHAVFLGTDATERWTREEFMAYAKPRFERNGGWTYRMTSRHISVSKEKNTAWFDELLSNENYGECRGSGVLVREEGVWKVAQYHLTIPIPNSLARKVVSMIRDQKK